MVFIKQVTTNDFEAIEKEIRAGHKTSDDIYGTWKKLHEDLKGGTSGSDKNYWWTYFRLYTELTWKLSSELNRDEFVNIAIGRQIPMAFLLDFDVWKTIMWFIASRGLDDKDMSSLYSEIRTAFFESNAFVGSWKGKDVVIKDLVADVRSIKQANANSMVIAEVMSKIKEAFFAKENPNVARYAIADSAELVEQFVSLCDFFAEHEPDRIWNIVQAYVNPSFVENVAAFIEKNEKALEDLDNGVVPTLRPDPAKEPAFTSQVTTSDQKPTNLQIRMTAERQFEKDASGDFKDPEEIMGMLDEWATKYNDDKIRELFIFNEQTSSFEWNNQLLTK